MPHLRYARYMHAADGDFPTASQSHNMGVHPIFDTLKHDTMVGAFRLLAILMTHIEAT